MKHQKKSHKNQKKSHKNQKKLHKNQKKSYENQKKLYENQKKSCKNRSILNTLRKGSHTVEATVIMGVTFLVLAAILYMGSFLYGRAIMTASAYEQAFTGRRQEEYGLFGFGSIERTCDFQEKENIVSYQGTCFSVWGGFRQEVQVGARVEQQQPVTFIRKWRAAETLIPD